MKFQKKRNISALLIGALFATFALGGCAENQEAQISTTYAMNTIIEQRAWGAGAQQAMQQVNEALAEYDQRLSMYTVGSDIARINASAGGEGVEVAPETAQLLTQALELSAQSEGAFAITVAPLTNAWAVTSENPRVPTSQELQELLPLVNDSLVQIDGTRVTLPLEGMGIDLGGIAKGAACAIAAEIYSQHNLTAALLWIGGNTYVYGQKPDNAPFNIGFADPSGQQQYIATVEMQNEVIAVSGGHERYFEQDGQTYIHIFNSSTGLPVESDIVSVGVVHANGAEADFWSTTLFVWGKERALEYMQSGGRAILLDNTNTIYVSQSLQDVFELYEQETGRYTVVYV